jgi:recombination protein RecA
MYGQGISRDGEILDMAVQLEIINKSGAWFSCGEERLGQGRDNVKNYLQEHPDFAETIAKQVMENKDKLVSAPRKKGSKAEAASAAAEEAPAKPAKNIDIAVEVEN